jgi:hypothetical protein
MLHNRHTRRSLLEGAAGVLAIALDEELSCPSRH